MAEREYIEIVNLQLFLLFAIFVVVIYYLTQQKKKN